MEIPCYGMSSTETDSSMSTIQLDRVLTQEGFDMGGFNSYAGGRFNTLLHEACHAFIDQYSCQACPMRDVNLGTDGHQRAFQLLAAKVEAVGRRLLNVEICLNRFHSYCSDWEYVKVLPSVHDLEQWQLETEEIEDDSS